MNARTGISIQELFERFPDDAAAQRWFEERRWPDTRTCPRCDSDRTAPSAKATMPYRCRACGKHFSVRIGTVMERSNLGYRTWAIATYLMVTHVKGVSANRLHRDLGITYKSAWHLAHRLREALRANEDPLLRGPVEVDETYVGGKEKNKHEHQRRVEKGGPSEKIAVVGAKDRATNHVRAEVVGKAEAPKLRNFVRRHAAPGAHLFSDGHGAYFPLDGEFKHNYVQHSAGTYVIERTHTNGIESFWSVLKRAYVGTYHHMSPKHLDRYVSEFSGRHNLRALNTIEQMEAVADGMVGKRLRYQDLVA